jgi:hypothetical protein
MSSKKKGSKKSQKEEILAVGDDEMVHDHKEEEMIDTYEEELIVPTKKSKNIDVVQEVKQDLMEMREVFQPAPIVSSRPLRVFLCRDHAKIGMLKPCALMVADSEATATKLLDEKLYQFGLKTSADHPYTLSELDLTRPTAAILSFGEMLSS